MHRMILLIICCIVVLGCQTGTLFAQAFQGYTLYSPFGGKNSYIINMNNQIVKSWTHAKSGGYCCYLMPDGSVMRPALSTNSSLGGGGEAGIVQRVAWNGTSVWEYQYSSSTYRTHHDMEPLPNGNVLLIAWEVKTAAQAVQAGSMRNSSFWPDHIIEVQPIGTTGGNIVWQWHAFDHLIQDYDATKSNYGVVKDHPELLNINMTGNGPSGDWMHINAVSYNPVLDQIVISSHNLNEIYVIDHSTTTAQAASHSGGNSGRGGDILYRWGKPSNYKITGTTIFDVVHCAWWVPQGVPGAGHIMAFNNRASTGISNIVEIVPPSDSLGNYSWTAGTAYGPASTFWNYTASGFYSNHLGSNQRLPNGNTLISESTSGYLFEVTSTGSVVWTYSPGGQIARSLRYDPSYPGLSALTGGTLTKNIQLSEGWNIVSVPLNVSNFTVSTLFPAATSPAYGFNNGYISTATLTNGKSYWIRYPQAATVSFSGTAPATTISIAQGWNLIGVNQNDVSTSAITSLPAGIINSLYYGYNNGYTSATTLNPGKGYWVRSTSAGTITIPASFAKSEYESKISIPAGSGSLTITDAIGNRQTLYMTNAGISGNADIYDMPPLPPNGVFDARFSSNTVLVNSNSPAEILVKDAAFPIVISVKDMAINVIDRATNGVLVNQNVTDKTDLTIGNPTSQLQVSVLSAPAQFSVEQNFPNPFNPSTIIRYELAQTQKVSLIVYDVLGNEIVQLVNGSQNAGKHEAKFDASACKNLPSGIYLYRLQAGNSVKINKMIFLK